MDDSLEIVFTEEQKENVFVQSLPTPNQKQPQPKKEVRLKSDRTNRVDLETWKRPERQAEMQSSLRSGGKKGNNKKKKNKKESKQQSKAVADKGDYQVEDRKPLSLPGFSGGEGRPSIPTYVQERLPPGVRLGGITALNTDQHRFYSFNQRLLSRFVPIWGERVRRALYQWLKDNNAPAISKSWVTNVEVIMNKEGEILDVQPFRLSGLWSIDQASIESFQGVKNVPNPPQEMIDENGYIHLQFQTEVLYVPRPGVRFHGGN